MLYVLMVFMLCEAIRNDAKESGNKFNIIKMTVIDLVAGNRGTSHFVCQSLNGICKCYIAALNLTGK